MLKLVPLLVGLALVACRATDPAGPAGEGEGDAVVGVVGEGEGERVVVGEGEGEVGEGEGDAVVVGGEGEEGEGEGEGEVPLAQRCFGDITSPQGQGPQYDPFRPVVGSHCQGTNQQDIRDIERVVFLGDSVTVGTPPTASGDIYRAILADALAERFGLEAPSSLWKLPNPLSGTSTVKASGDFASCAKWGARTDDLARDNSQILDCFPAEERSKHTLVIMTVGGNDVAALTKDGVTRPVDEMRVVTEEFVDNLRQAVHLLKDRAEFPGGVDVIFANNFEFTDGTGDVSSCPAASTAGFDQPWEDPAALADLVVWATEQYMDIAVSEGADMIFLLESFCGHGYHNDDVDNGCYRPADHERWFDVSCIHPNPTGHRKIADLFLSVVDE